MNRLYCLRSNTDHETATLLLMLTIVTLCFALFLALLLLPFLPRPPRLLLGITKEEGSPQMTLRAIK